MKNWIVVIVIAGAAGFWWYTQKSEGTDSLADSQEVLQSTGTADFRNIKLNVSVAGEIGPAERVSVRPEVNGKIAELPVDIGDKVKKGDLLFSLDDRNLKIEIESCQTDIASAEIQLQSAKQDYERNKKLLDELLISQEVFEDSKTAYELAENNIERAQKALALAQDRLSKTRILAPFNCTVLTRPVSAGQAVSGSGGFNSGTEVLTIADLNEMIINAHVNQADVTRLKKDMEVDVQIEAVPGLTVKGVVERIAPQATIVNGIKGFSARIKLIDVDERIQPGMTANISIPVASAENVLSVPLSAVFTEFNPDAEKQERYVFVEKDGKFEKRLVDVGISDYFNAEILRGLNGGEKVSLEQPPKALIVESPSGTQLAGPSGEKSNRGGI